MLWERDDFLCSISVTCDGAVLFLLLLMLPQVHEDDPQKR